MGNPGHWTPRWYPPEPKREPPPAAPEKEREPTPTEDVLLDAYQCLRLDIDELEQIIGGGDGLTEDDLKRLDKAVTLIKVGAKMVKRVLRAHGASGKLKCPPSRSEVVRG